MPSPLGPWDPAAGHREARDPEPSYLGRGRSFYTAWSQINELFSVKTSEVFDAGSAAFESLFHAPPPPPPPPPSRPRSAPYWNLSAAVPEERAEHNSLMHWTNRVNPAAKPALRLKIRACGTTNLMPPWRVMLPKKHATRCRSPSQRRSLIIAICQTSASMVRCLTFQCRSRSPSTTSGSHLFRPRQQYATRDRRLSRTRPHRQCTAMVDRRLFRQHQQHISMAESQLRTTAATRHQAPLPPQCAISRLSRLHCPSTTERPGQKILGFRVGLGFFSPKFSA